MTETVSTYHARHSMSRDYLPRVLSGQGITPGDAGAIAAQYHTTHPHERNNAMPTAYATVAKPAHVIQQARYIVMFWPVPGSVPNEHGHSLHRTLTLEHTDKAYRAIESTAMAADVYGSFVIDLQIGQRPSRVTLAQVPAARYSAASFKAFVKSVLT